MSDTNRPTQTPPLLRSFGRRRGRKLSPRQDDLLSGMLPKVALDLASPPPGRLTEAFGSKVDRVWLEIGFGGAEHLLWQAAHHPDVGVIGAEPFEDGVVKALHGIDEAKLGNVRLHADDARPLLDWLPERSIDRAFVLFPDPWPKKRHAKRRLVNEALLDALARAMRPGGELRLATDIDVYARDMLLAVRRQKRFQWAAEGPATWRIRPSDWPETRYERKAVREHRKPMFFTLFLT